jgi:methylphosphotriester-DNA--protein-cysteine methyltransferase
MERLCRKHFGFSPKLLLRRQRFMRSLAQFVLDPSLGWIGALDSLYFDQSHFVRDCRDFLGMAPSEYVAADHPVILGFMRERMRAHGSAVQTLDSPEAS